MQIVEKQDSNELLPVSEHGSTKEKGSPASISSSSSEEVPGPSLSPAQPPATLRPTRVADLFTPPHSRAPAQPHEMPAPGIAEAAATVQGRPYPATGSPNVEDGGRTDEANGRRQ